MLFHHCSTPAPVRIRVPVWYAKAAKPNRLLSLPNDLISSSVKPLVFTHNTILLWRVRFVRPLLIMVRLKKTQFLHHGKWEFKMDENELIFFRDKDRGRILIFIIPEVWMSENLVRPSSRCENFQETFLSCDAP